MIHLDKEPTSPSDEIEKKATTKELEDLKEELFKLQSILYAENKRSLLIVLQGMDTSGKDGTIRHVFTCVNPQGCRVHSFKAPTIEEASHDFLWRIHAQAPQAGMIQIFNRSQYEDILYPTVHKTFDNAEIEKRYDKINRFEDDLRDRGTTILKFFLHISLKEQKERIANRLKDETKRWKYSKNDTKEEQYWDKYMETYEKIVNRCSPEVPWTIVPADHKWYRNYVVAKKLVETMKALKLQYPK